jgi:hypothetical protein
MLIDKHKPIVSLVRQLVSGSTVKYLIFLEKKMKYQQTQLAKNSMLTLSVIALSLASGFAQAAMVETWTYSTNATYSAPSWSPADGIGDGVRIANASELSWGLDWVTFRTLPTMRRTTAVH